MFDPSAAREIDSLYVVRAFAISAVVANHSLSMPLAGGLNLLLLLSGMAFAQLAFGGQKGGSFATIALQFVRPLVTWSLVLCVFWFLVFQRAEIGELLLYSNWLTLSRVSKFPIWYTQVLVQILLCLVVLFGIFGLTERMRANPVLGSLVALGLTVALAALCQWRFDTDALGDKLPHLHAWNFVVGWLFWAILKNRNASWRDRMLLSVLCVPLFLFMYLGLDVPAAASRVQIAILPVLVLIWLPHIRLPHFVLQPVLLISQATLFLFFLHYPFLLAARNLLEGRLTPDLLGVVKFGVAMVGPIIAWAFVTSAQRTFREARARHPLSVGPGLQTKRM